AGWAAAAQGKGKAVAPANAKSTIQAAQGPRSQRSFNRSTSCFHCTSKRERRKRALGLPEDKRGRVFPCLLTRAFPVTRPILPTEDFSPAINASAFSPRPPSFSCGRWAFRNGNVFSIQKELPPCGATA